MSPKSYFDDYDSDDLDLSKEEFAKLWELNRKYFITLLEVCPFPISKDAYNWIVSASLDI